MPLPPDASVCSDFLRALKGSTADTHQEESKSANVSDEATDRTGLKSLLREFDHMNLLEKMTFLL
ncbi:hypothetical protein CYFUS_004728 [Cystobacter fuscus]|uniref:Uncharacterized protein n=2 Tax=Cystobacter fuscus TaxID=43 RepID=A0A250J5S1_9BACT|nr:hypothetical protein CYFUS_004728 [Cystobacter fuscus]